MPLRRTIRSIHSLALAYRREREQLLGSSAPEDQADFGGLQASWIWSSAREYPMSISPSEGTRLRVSWLHESEGLGSDVSLDKLSFDARIYERVFGARDVLALRLGGGTTWGEPGFERSFAVGGYPDASLFDIVRTNEAVLRGYPDNAFTGRRYAAVQRRVPLPARLAAARLCARCRCSCAISAARLFFDAANAWSGDFKASTSSRPRSAPRSAWTRRSASRCRCAPSCRWRTASSRAATRGRTSASG